MITSENIQSDVRQVISDAFSRTATQLLQVQSNVLHTAYVRQTGMLSDRLASKPYTINQSDTQVSMTIDYYKQIRFLDLKKTAKGKPKQRYAPIYNKYIWGFMMGYVYNAVRAGLRGTIDRQLTSTTLTVDVL